MRHSCIHVLPSPSGRLESAPLGALGFTLVEVLIRVAIIGILAAIAYPSYIDSVT